MKTLKILHFVSFSLILFLSSNNFLSAQQSCLPSPEGVRPGDEPPGCTICSYDTYTGSTGGNTPEQPPIDAPCTVENSQWLNFTSSTNKVFNVKIQAYSCSKGKGIEAVLFDKDFIPVSDCFQDKPGSGASFMQVTNIKPLETYHLMIDGIDGDICGFRFTPVSGLHLPIPFISDIDVSEDFPDDLCLGTRRIYSVSASNKSTFYRWGPIPRIGKLIAGGGILDSFMSVEYKQTGSGSISVTPLNICIDTIEGPTRTHNLRITEILSTRTETVEFCIEELPLIYKGVYINAFQTIRTDVLSNDSCTYKFILKVVEKKEIVPQFDTLVCPGNCVILNDSCVHFPMSAPTEK